MGQATPIAMSHITSLESNDRQPKWFALVNDQIVPIPRPEVPVHLIKTQAQIPPGHKLLRDYDSPDDITLPDDARVDLRAGNVFYSEADCAANDRGRPTQPPKFALAVDDRWEVVIRPDQTGGSVRELFNLENDVELFRDYESPIDNLIEDETPCSIKDGPVFYTRKCPEIAVKVNNKPVKFSHRRVTGQKIKQTAIAQGVALCADCVLYRVKPGGGFGPAIRDEEKVTPRDCDEFRCITPDDQS